MKLLVAKLLSRHIGRRKFHISKCKSLFHEDIKEKDGQRIKSDEEKDWEKFSFKDKLLLELNLIMEGIKETTSDFKDKVVRGQKCFIYDHHVDVLWRFTGDKSELNNWVVTTDKDQNVGYSSAQLEFTQDSKGLFYGFLDTKLPSNGLTKQAGMCNLRTIGKLSPFKNVVVQDWEGYTHLVLRLRGDGRVYAINIHLDRYFDICAYDTYHYFIWTRGGPYWQHVRIPFSKFFFGYKGRIQAKSEAMPLNEIKYISFTLSDKIKGPFRLEIDYIGIEKDPSHIEKSAYESYNIRELIW